jgi:RNA polymerase sigma factor (sigma-70 family)
MRLPIARTRAAVLGAVARRFRDFSSAEDGVQEAMIAAFPQWPQQGVPENPRGWLIQVASRRMTDHMRSEIARRERETAVAAETENSTSLLEANMDPDDTLILLFMCCHPALSPSSAIALTLRAVGGLTTAEIANAFLVPEATMAQRISRAKQTIKTSGVPFRLPFSARADWTTEGLHLLYLIFSEDIQAALGHICNVRLLYGERADSITSITRKVIYNQLFRSVFLVSYNNRTTFAPSAVHHLLAAWHAA